MIGLSSSMEFAATSGRDIDQGATLIVPVNSVGNIGQLVVDLIIQNWGLNLIGQLCSEAVLPCVGSNAFQTDSKDISTELQVFGKEDIRNLAVIQQRSPVSLGNESRYASELASWVQSHNLSQVVVLGSIDAELRRDSQLEGTQLRFKAHGSGQDQLAALGIPELEDRPPADTPWEESLLPPWPLFRSLRAKNVSCILITAFASEGGGNAQDAVAMASTIQTLLKADSHTLSDAAIPSHQWQFPVSWAHVFGRPADMSAY